MTNETSVLASDLGYLYETVEIAYNKERALALAHAYSNGDTRAMDTPLARRLKNALEKIDAYLTIANGAEEEDEDV